MGLMERILRIFDQLDEQLHAGFYFYLVIGIKKFISCNEYMYPAALIFAGLLIPNFFDYYEQTNKSQEDDKKNMIKSNNKDCDAKIILIKQDQTWYFLGLLYFMCMMFAILPMSMFLALK